MNQYQHSQRKMVIVSEMKSLGGRKLTKPFKVKVEYVDGEFAAEAPELGVGVTGEGLLEATRRLSQHILELYERLVREPNLEPKPALQLALIRQRLGIGEKK